jgi:sugar phosphate isomerase/epimerase
MDVPNTKIALTLYTVRASCVTAEDLDDTLRRVSAMGYRAVQISGIGPVSPERVKELLDKHGLYCCATHESLVSLQEDLPAVVEKLRILECPFTAIGSGGGAYWTEDGASRLAVDLNAVGKQLADQGIRFGFHNHHREFARFGGRVFLEELFEKTDPDTVHFELDVHWVQRGGANPVSWIKKAAGRASVVHFKDCAVVGSEPIFCEVGEGNLEWPAILAACEASGVRWYVFEQDTPVAERDVFASAELTYRNLRNMGVT